MGRGQRLIQASDGEWLSIQVAPSSLHPAFDKAGKYFDVEIRHVQVDPVKLICNLTQLEAAIDGNTILIAASAPSYPQVIHGTSAQLFGYSGWVAQMRIKVVNFSLALFIFRHVYSIDGFPQRISLSVTVIRIMIWLQCYAGCSSWRKASPLPGLGTGTSYQCRPYCYPQSLGLIFS